MSSMGETDLRPLIGALAHRTVRACRRDVPPSYGRNGVHPVLGMLGEPLTALSHPQHHVPKNRIAQLLGDVARVFRPLAPVSRVVEDGCAHDSVALSAFRPVGSSE